MRLSPGLTQGFCGLKREAGKKRDGKDGERGGQQEEGVKEEKRNA